MKPNCLHWLKASVSLVIVLANFLSVLQQQRAKVAPLPVDPIVLNRSVHEHYLAKRMSTWPPTWHRKSAFGSLPT